MQPPAHRRLSVDKRLYPQAHAIHTRGHHRRERLFHNLSRRAFHGNLRVRLKIKLSPHLPEQPPQQLRRKQTWRSPAQVNRIHESRQLHAHPPRPIPSPPQILDNPFHIAPMFTRRVDPRSKVAVSTLRSAKRNRNINTQRVAVKTSHNKDSFTCHRKILAYRTKHPFPSCEVSTDCSDRYLPY